MRKMFLALEILETLILSSVGLNRANPSATDPRLHLISNHIAEYLHVTKLNIRGNFLLYDSCVADESLHKHTLRNSLTSPPVEAVQVRSGRSHFLILMHHSLPYSQFSFSPVIQCMPASLLGHEEHREHLHW
jgi:hypothetical protein